MAAYPATNDLALLVETNPTGGEDASKIDDAMRESRRTFKAVLLLIHTTLGGLKAAMWRDKPSGLPNGSGYPAPAGENVWHAHSYNNVLNVANVDTSTNSSIFKPISGTYLILAWAPGYKIDRHQIRLYNITDTIPVANVFGNPAWSPNAPAQPTQDISFLMGTFTTNGNKQYRIEHIHQTNNTTNGWGVGTYSVGGWTSAEMNFGGVVLVKIG